MYVSNKSNQNNMEPKVFPQVNAVFGADQPEYKPLPALQTSDGYVVMCFQMTEEEKKKIAETGEIWISLMTGGGALQPIYVTTEPGELFYTTTKEEESHEQI